MGNKSQVMFMSFMLVIGIIALACGVISLRGDIRVMTTAKKECPACKVCPELTCPQWMRIDQDPNGLPKRVSVGPGVLVCSPDGRCVALDDYGEWMDWD